MEKENPKFYVEDLDGIRTVASELMQLNSECIPDAKELFALKINGLTLRLQRDVRHRQLHLDPDAAVYMDHLQSELAQISEDCNAVLASEKKGNLATERKACFETLITVTNGLFEYFREYYGYCFNFQMTAPVRLKNRADLVLVKLWDKLIPSLRDIGVEEGLLEVLTVYYSEQYSNKKPTFHELDFWRTITCAINKIELKKVPHIEDSLCMLFCYHNFNYMPLIQFYINRMRRDYDKIESYREEYINLTVELRTIGQIFVKKNYGYDHNATDFRKALCQILENEVLCLKKLMNMNKKLFEGKGARFFFKQFYFRISISMEQFLFIFRLMIDEGIVIVKRKADLFEFIHCHIGTVHKDNLSTGNMQNTYSENNRKTAIKVRALLQLLITHIDKKYLTLCSIVSVL